jgi:hypothetical protein
MVKKQGINESETIKQEPVTEDVVQVKRLAPDVQISSASQVLIALVKEYEKRGAIVAKEGGIKGDKLPIHTWFVIGRAAGKPVYASFLNTCVRGLGLGIPAIAEAMRRLRDSGTLAFQVTGGDWSEIQVFLSTVWEIRGTPAGRTTPLPTTMKVYAMSPDRAVSRSSDVQTIPDCIRALGLPMMEEQDDEQDDEQEEQAAPPTT